MEFFPWLPFNSKVKQQVDVRQEEALEEDTWAETLKELDKGWIWKDSSQSWEGKCCKVRVAEQYSLGSR